MTATGLAHQADPAASALRVVPKEWRMCRIKDACALNADALPENTDPEFRFRYCDISSVDSLGHIAPSEPMPFGSAPSRARRLVKPGDSIVSTVRTYLKAIAHIDAPCDDLVVSTGFATLSPGPDLMPGYLYWWLRSENFIEEVVARSVGVSYPAVNASNIGDIALALPPLGEQRRIVEYLDTETARIDDLIDEQERLHVLAVERLHAHASEVLGARLGGPPGPFESVLAHAGSGTPLVPLRQVAVIQSGVTLGKSYDTGASSYPYLRVANVHDGVISTENITTIEVPSAVAARHLLRAGDVLMTEGGDNDKLGRGAVWDGSIEPCLHQNHIFAVRPGPQLRPKYLSALLGSAWGRAYFTATAHQTTNLASTNRAKVGRFPVPLPDLQAQDEVIEELESASSRAAAISSEVSLQVELLREHRQALITAAATGGLEAVGRVA